MQYVESRDGTRIAFEQIGDGPPLVLVHGAASDHTRWAPLIEHIEDHFTLHVMDRRGRGNSGDGPDYELRREVEDIIAVAAAIDGPVHLYGHSSGALYSLEAAPEINNLQRLVLYEPAMPEGGEFIPAPIIDQLQTLVDEERSEEALILFMRDVAKFPEHEIEKYQSLPSWPARVAAAPTFPREGRTINSYRFDPDRFRDFAVPTLLLQGNLSPQMFADATRRINATLLDSRVVLLPEQGHAADSLAPELVASTLCDFLIDDETGA